MDDFWLGVSPNTAKFVFLLPNKPVLPEDEREKAYCSNVALLIDLNGNHWRKILTIMAKLLVPKGQHWRDFRDNALFDQTAVVFSPDQLKVIGASKVFIVGNGFREVLPIIQSSRVIGEKQQAYVASERIWCPYLDYRQFPNSLIAALREWL